MKTITIVGARPQFIKAAAVSNALTKLGNMQEIIVHTGQHFDTNMSDIFFTEMRIPTPKYHLNINSLNHGAMTGKMLAAIEEILISEKPDWVLVYGDTNSTLAGALAAAKLHIKVAHVEAGLRSFNMKMPEEINRILTDRISNLLFVPTQNAYNNLINEGFGNFNSEMVISGDVMYDVALRYQQFQKKPDNFHIPENFVLATIHRAENTDNTQNLIKIFTAFIRLTQYTNVVIPLHPRTYKIINTLPIFSEINNNNKIIITQPVPYTQMVYLLNHCKMVLTDSGGLQKEAYFSGKYCITLRSETEWIELVENGYNIVTDTNVQATEKAYHQLTKKSETFIKNLYGTGNASEIIATHLNKMLL